MKHLLRASLLALPLLALSANDVRAHGQGLGLGLGPYTAGASITFGARGWLRPGCDQGPGGYHPSYAGYGGGGAAPWYTYWPMEAYYQVPAPTHYPYWPAPMTSGMPGPGHSYYQPAPSGYYPAAYYGPAPSYWYSH
jgi:hypothetical protein